MATPGTEPVCSGDGSSSAGSARCDAPAGDPAVVGAAAGPLSEMPAMAPEPAPIRYSMQSIESDGCDARESLSQRAGGGATCDVDAAESDGSDFQRSFSDHSDEGSGSVLSADDGVVELRMENDELHRRARYLEERLQATELAVGRTREVRSQNRESAAGATVDTRSDTSLRSRLLWQNAILAVRTQVSRKQQRVLSQRLVDAEAKAKEVASRSRGLEEELSNIFEDNRACLLRAEQEKARLRDFFAAEKMRMERAHQEKMLEMRRSLHLGVSEPGSSSFQSRAAGSAQRPSSEVVSGHPTAVSSASEASSSCCAAGGRGGNPDQLRLQEVAATVETQRGEIQQLLSYTKALEARVREKAKKQSELQALRQRLRLLESQEAASSAPQAS